MKAFSCSFIRKENIERKLINTEKYFNKIYLNEMDNHNQVIKLCGIRGNKRVYNDYHRLYNPCKICVAKNSARNYQANRDKIIARSKLYQENTKHVKKISYTTNRRAE